MADVKRELRIATFLTPSVSIEFFEALMTYLESKIQCQTTLRYESRFEGPVSERGDVFKDSIDLAFMTANGFLQLQKSFSEPTFELFPLSTVHLHPKGDNSSPHVWVDIVVNKNMKNIRDFVTEMRGVRWVRNVNDQLTQALTLHSLKTMGENATFFSNVLKSRSHLESLRMILQRKAHASAVDANCLEMYLRENPDEREELFTILSWGPLPPYALVIRKSLDEDFKRKLFDTLSTMHDTPEGKIILSSFKILRFDRIKHQDLEFGQDLIAATKNMSFDTVYY
jgi:hypothetical protein